MTVCVTAVFAPSPLARAADDKVTFNDHVLPIFRSNCNGCHNADKKKAGLDLTSYQAALAGGDNGSVINTADAGGSQLYKVMTHAAEPTMPPKKDKLPQAELETVRKWIAGGALESMTGKAAAAVKPKVDLGTVAVTGKPSGPVAMPVGLASEPIVHTARAGAVESLAASPWAPVVAVGGQRQVVLYHARSLDVLGVLPFPEGVPLVLRFSRNGSLLLAAGGEGAKAGKVVLYDVATGARLIDVGDEQDQVLAADLSPDQKFVALGGPARLVKVLDAADGKELYSIKKHTDWVTAIAISPDGQYLASGDRAGNLYMFEANNGGELHTLAGHKDAIAAVSFRGDSNVLLSASKDGTIKLWDMSEGKQLKSADAHRGGVTSASFAHDGRIVSCGRDKVVKVWDSAITQAKWLTPAFGDLALHATFDGEDRQVVAGDWSGVVRVWDLGGQVGPDGKPTKGKEAEPKVLGELTPNPPRIADRLELATKKLATAEAAVAKAEADAKTAQDAVDKAAAEEKSIAATISSAKKAIVDGEAVMKASDDLLSGKPVEKADRRLARAKEDLDRLTAAGNQAGKDAEATLADAARVAAANVNAAPAGTDLAALEADHEARKKRLAEADAALAKAKAAAKAVVDAKASMTAAGAEQAVAEKAVADAKGAMAKATADRAEAAKAVPRAKEELKAAEAKTKSAVTATAGANVKALAAKKVLDEAKAAVAGATYDVAKLMASRAATTMANAKAAMKAKQDAKQAADGAEKAAVAAVEKAKADVVSFKKARVESPAKVKQLAAQLPALTKAAADVVAPAEAAAKAAADRTAVATLADELSRKIAEQARQSTDSKGLADADAAAKKVLESLAADLTTAKGKAAKWAEARKKADADLASVEQAIAKEKSDTENAGKITEGLAKAVADAEADLPKKRATAQEAAAPVEEAKAAVDQAKAEYDRLSAEAAKLTPTPVANRG